MNVAVLTMTRDRLAYTQHCFETLRANAGCDFDWFVLDQGSSDRTPEWLLDQEDIDATLLPDNIGICRGLNLLLDEAVNPDVYEVLVRFDNDCQVLQPGTLRIVAELASEYQTILAPRVLGLRNPPPTLNQFKLGGWAVDETAILGGIFMAIPATAFSVHGYRFDETYPPWTGDEAITAWWRGKGGRCGYVEALQVNHYLTTDGQHDDQPEYFQRRVLEGGPV